MEQLHTADEVQFRARTKSFVRRSRGLAQNLSRVLDQHGATYLVPVARADSATTIAPDTKIDWDQQFGRRAPLVVEVGSGNGEQIVAAAAAHPEQDYLSFEVWHPGVAKMISRAASAGVTNLRIVEADAAQALPLLLGPDSVSEVWTFFPDPWRKKRHHKRRLVDGEFAGAVATILAPEGCWRLATDWDDYAWQMRDTIESEPNLVNPHRGARPDPLDPEPTRGGFAPRFPGRLLTRFEEKGLEAGRTVHDLTAIKPARKEQA